MNENEWELTDEEVATAARKGADEWLAQLGAPDKANWPMSRDFAYRAVATAAQRKLVEWMKKNDLHVPGNGLYVPFKLWQAILSALSPAASKPSRPEAE